MYVYLYAIFFARTGRYFKVTYYIAVCLLNAFSKLFHLHVPVTIVILINALMGVAIHKS